MTIKHDQLFASLCQAQTIALVEEFHQAFDVPVMSTPDVHEWSEDRIKLRIKLLREELQELEDAIEIRDKVETFDALLDLQYVLDGTFLELGYAAMKAAGFATVHLSNMSKLGIDGKPVLREDGKVLKGPDFWEPQPELHKILKGCTPSNISNQTGFDQTDLSASQN